MNLTDKTYLKPYKQFKNFVCNDSVYRVDEPYIAFIINSVTKYKEEKGSNILEPQCHEHISYSMDSKPETLLKW